MVPQPVGAGPDPPQGLIAVTTLVDTDAEFNFFNMQWGYSQDPGDKCLTREGCIKPLKGIGNPLPVIVHDIHAGHLGLRIITELGGLAAEA